MKSLKSLLGLAAGIVMLASAPAVAQEKATLRLNWLIYGFHTPFYLGIERGYYKAEGIDLEVGEGQGSGRAVQIVAAKGDTFGLSDGASIINGITKGAPIKAVMGIMNTTPFAVIARADSGIKSMKDLEGRTIAATTGEAGLTILPALIKGAGLDQSKINFLRVDGPTKLVAVLEKRADALLGGSENQPFILEQKGVASTVFNYADYGVNTMGLAIHVHADTLKDKPKLVEGFIRATQKAYAEAEKDPEAAIAAGLKVKPDMDKAMALKQLQAGLKLVRSKAAPTAAIGFMAPADWQMTLDLMKDYQELKTDMTAASFFSNDLLPK
ncbi:ABC transporter substrate-binding protein [Prosthecomicrobium hirschii]|uniref:Sulfonate ABC transporter substrate-binding protein n=1 Tax=Prosthecodimorpha hirschii TaxID=665126 RepID=A0A0P6VSH1_9HYPH|nr:ABC transporter substrate-binding protein [Prosthecomicrobium hirschii]KPL54155.1 sulfonate ABC transporter substrate-binding protein [Prosthecomicrobium hirschii]MCW1841049.1 ABC transporter substrate-binding protein [Prosthecomicrobium hirschii]